MKARALVKKFLMERYETTDSKKLSDDFGVRIKVSANENITISRSYFYKTLCYIDSNVKDFIEFAARNDVVATSNGVTSYEHNQWPKTSWGSQKIVIS